MDFPSYYSDAEQKIVSSKLEPDEELIWTAKPQPRLFRARRWLFLSMMAILCLLFILLDVDGLLFVVCGFFIIAGGIIPLCSSISQRKIIYVLTNRRALILHPTNKFCVCEWSGSNLKVLEVKHRRKDAMHGHIVLERGEESSIRGFFNIENPLQVAELVKACAAQGVALECKEVERTTRHYASRIVPMPTGEDEKSVMPWLSSCEQLLWVGHPKVRLWSSGMISVSMVGLMILFVLYAECDFVLHAFQTPVVTASVVWLGLIFLVVMGVPFVFASLWLRNRSSKTLYILTDKRAIVVKPHWFTGAMKMVHTWDLESHSVMKIGEDSRRGRYDMIWSYNQNITINDEPLAEGFLDMVSVEIPLAVLAKLQGFHQDNIINS